MVLLLSPAAHTQQPKVLAPHKSSFSKLEPAQPFGKPLHQTAAGGLWMTGPNVKASLYLKNTMKTNSLTVTPAFYLSSGVRVAGSSVALEPSGIAIVDINQSLAQQGIAPYATLYGYAEIEYDWPWAPVSASVRNVDAQNSLIFIYPLQAAPAVHPADGPSNAQPANNLEGFWWKQEKDVSGFIALANVTGRAVNSAVRVTDDAEIELAAYQLTVPPHETKMINLDQLKSTPGNTGGLFVSYDGDEHGLAVSGGLEDQAVGYSARLPFLSSPKPAQNSAPEGSTQMDFAELGLMTGAADPMMNFPYGTTFTPYSLIRNISEQPATITPTIWWMSGGTAHSARLGSLRVAPHRTLNLDVQALLGAAGLENFNASVDLVLDTEAQFGALALAAGSVDQTKTYVFEVIPRAVGEGSSQALCYWSTANGDDTMVSLWNPADEAQDFTFTLFYSGGHYVYPVHMEPRAAHAFNISEIIHSSLPDSEGNVIPAAIQAGSAEIAGLGGEQQHILVNMDAAVYNVKKAICGTGCIVCNGVVNSFIVADPFSVTIGGTQQETFYVQYNTGTQYNLNGHSSWSSSNTGQATVSSGLVTGVSAGSSRISARDLDFEPIYNSCATSRTSCTAKTNAFQPSGSTQGTVRVPTSVRWINTVESGTAVCPTGQAGYSRQVTLELDDQSGQALAFSGITMADSIQNTATNQLGLGAPKTASFPTNAAGQWPDQYYACSTVCPGSTGETDALQYWTANGSPLPHVNSLVYKCKSNTIDGK